MKAGRIRVFDIGRGSNGYDASVHLFSNSGDDNGTSYIDLITHRHHVRWGKLVGGAIAERRCANGKNISPRLYTTRPRVGYCKQKAEIPVEVPLLQNDHHCGGRRRNSLGTEGYQWRTSSMVVEPVPASLSWIPSPSTPIAEGDGIRVDPPPSVAPPLRDSAPEEVLQHRMATLNRWSRNDDSSFPLISFNWRDNARPRITKVAQKYLGGVDLEFSLATVCVMSPTWGSLGRNQWGGAHFGQTHPRYYPFATRTFNQWYELLTCQKSRVSWPSG